MQNNIYNLTTGQTGYQAPGAPLPAGWQTNSTAPTNPLQATGSNNAVLPNGTLANGQAANPADVYSSSSYNQPISTASLSGSTPLTLPTPTDTTGQATAAITSTTQANIDAQTQAEANIAKANQSLQPIQDQKNSILDSIKGLFSQQSDAQTAAIQDNSAIDPYRQQLADINKQIADVNVAYRGEKDSLGGGFLTKGQAQQSLSDIDTKYGRQLADLAIRQSAANLNINSLQTAADRKLALTLAPIQSQVSYLQNFALQNADDLTKQEQDKISQMIAEKNNIITRETTQQGVANDAIKAALTAGVKIPDQVVQQIQQNPSQAYQIMAANGINLQTQKYSALPFGATGAFNLQTGDVKTIGNSTNTNQTIADQNNNPGNLKGPDGQFQTFTSQADGQQALIQDLTAKMTGATSTGLTANSTLQDLANIWAPSSDNNNPAQYAKNLAAQLGVSVDTPIGTLLPRVNEVAAAIAKNEGGTYIDQQAPLKIASQYAINLTPEQASNFNKIPQTDQGTVAGVLKGTRLISGLTTRSGYNQTILNYAQSVDPTFDPASTEAGQKFKLSTDTQKFVANANTAQNTLDKIITLSNQVDRTNISVLNNGLLKVKQGISDPNAVQLATLSGILADELGKILGSSQGTDFTIQLGQSLVNPALSKEAFAAQANLLKDRIANKLSEYQAQGNQGGTSGSSGSVDFTSALDKLLQQNSK